MEIQKLRCHFFDTLWNMSQRKAAAAAASAAASTYVTDTVGIHRHRFAAGGGNEHMYAPSLARHHADLRYGGLGIGGPCQKSKLILCLKKVTRTTSSEFQLYSISIFMLNTELCKIFLLSLECHTQNVPLPNRKLHYGGIFQPTIPKAWQ